MSVEPVPLSELARDLPEPVGGWPVELRRRGVVIAADDLGRPAISRDEARAIYAEHFEAEARKARKAAVLERQAVEKDQAFRASLPRGVAQDQVPVGVSPALALMLSDPELQGSRRRRSVVEDALAHAGTVYTPINEDAP